MDRYLRGLKRTLKQPAKSKLKNVHNYDVQMCDIDIITNCISPDDKIIIRPLQMYVETKNYDEIAEWDIKSPSVKTLVMPYNISVFVDSHLGLIF